MNYNATNLALNMTSAAGGAGMQQAGSDVMVRSVRASGVLFGIVLCPALEASWIGVLGPPEVLVEDLGLG